MATLGMMYPARGGLVWGEIRGVLSEVRGSTTPRGVCITYWRNNGQRCTVHIAHLSWSMVCYSCTTSTSVTSENSGTRLTVVQPKTDRAAFLFLASRTAFAA